MLHFPACCWGCPALNTKKICSNCLNYYKIELYLCVPKLEKLLTIYWIRICIWPRRRNRNFSGHSDHQSWTQAVLRVRLLFSPIGFRTSPSIWRRTRRISVHRGRWPTWLEKEGVCSTIWKTRISAGIVRSSRHWTSENKQKRQFHIAFFNSRREMPLDYHLSRNNQ